MKFLYRFALLLVVFVDIMGQGLVLPIFNTLLLSDTSTFVKAGTPLEHREYLFGILTGMFFFAWFLGAAYIAKFSDYIGRKNGIIICLIGGMTGYALTIVAIDLGSFWLLLVARVISGFTAGNQPIAQAALVDISTSEAEKTRYMGLIVAATAVGLACGPLLAGLLSDKGLLGDIATLQLPFYAATALVAFTLIMVLLFYRDARTERRKIDFGPSEVFLALWRVKDRPTVIKLSLVFFFAQLGLNTFFLYLNNYLLERFSFQTIQNSAIMMLFGVTLAISSGFVAARLGAKYRRVPMILWALVMQLVFVDIFTLNPIADLSYVLLVPIVLAFGVAYPAMLSMFSSSVGEAEQGWVMGVTIALFTLGAGLVSVVAGPLIAISIHLPFIISICSYVVALVFLLTLWRQPDVRAIDPVPGKAPALGGVA